MAIYVYQIILGTKIAWDISMNNERMTFDIDRRSVTEGDVVEITWNCIASEQTDLTINNGYKTTTIQLPAEGSKRFRLNRSKGRTKLTIGVVIDGKRYTKKIKVRVKPMPTVHAETVDHQGRKQSRLKMWWHGVLTKCHDFRRRTKSSMAELPERKQIAVKMLTLLGILLILSAIWPQIYSFGYLILIIYLTVMLFRR